MRFVILASLLIYSAGKVLAQSHGFEFGKITYDELDMKIYDRDSTADAVVLIEFGDAFFDLDKLNVIYLQYHIKIKVLREQGKEYANFEIPLRKSGTRQELVRDIRASSFNREGNSWKESKLLTKDIYTNKVDADWSETKFAVPDVRIGSVLEVYYQLETPFTYNFVPWQFQSDIPKLKSEFWAKYPAYYGYNATLKGYLSLSKNTGEVIKNCVGSSSHVGAGGADCSLFKYSMENIPAFKEEEYMTAKRNFIAAISYELQQITQKDGRVDKITNEWKDVEQELKEHENFGVQIKKARNLYKAKAETLKALQSNPILLLTDLHNYFKGALTWNGEFGFLTDKGIKKTQEEGRGNVADLNLSMLGGLLEAGFEAEPVLLATRARGLPIMLHPVLSDFNYVVVRVKVAEKFYFLDATSSLYPVGFLPERCLNGQGRALGDTKAWIDLKPNDKDRIVSEFKIKLNDAGEIVGSAAINYQGYAAVSKRHQFFSKNNSDEYVKERTQNWMGVEASNFTVENERDLTKPFVEKFELTVEQMDGNPGLLYFPIFLYQRNEKNPFTSSERFYPVDFGAPTEYIYLLSFEFPASWEPEDLPQRVALALPNAGGRFLFGINKMLGKLNTTSSLTLSKPVYTSEEYHALRELYTRYIAMLQSMIVLKKK